MTFLENRSDDVFLFKVWENLDYCDKIRFVTKFMRCTEKILIKSEKKCKMAF